MQRLILFLIAIVLFGIAGFALIWFGAGRDLQGPSVAFLTQCRDSDFAAASQAFHPDYRDRWSPEHTERLWRFWGERYGDFGEVVRRIGAGAWHDSRKGAVYLELDLGFRGGHVVGWFYYVEGDEGPELAHVSLKPRARVDVSARERSRLEVTARKLFAWLDEGDVLSYYDALHPLAQMRTDIDAVAEREREARETLGALQDATLEKHASTDTSETQHFRLVHERGERVLRVMHRHEDGQWWVVEATVE